MDNRKNHRFGIAKQKSLKGVNASFISSQLFRDAENLLVKDVQKGLKEEIEKTGRKERKGGGYASLNPRKNKSEDYVIGQRLKNKNPMTPDTTSLQKLLPTRLTFMHFNCFTTLITHAL